MTSLSSAATSMDRMYRHQRFIYDVTRKPYLLGRDAMIGHLAPPNGGAVLEIGCGTGRNLIRAAHAYPTAHLYGFDVSAAMLSTTARRAISTAGLGERIIDCERPMRRSFDPARLFGEPAFDRVFISYVLSMIPDWRDAVLVHARPRQSLAPGGALHIVDFGQQNKLPRSFRTLLFSWLDLFHVTPRAELENELRMLAQGRGLHLDWRELYRGYAALCRLDRA